MEKTEKKSGTKTDAKKKTDTNKNKLGVKNSLVNNINAKKKEGKSHSKKDSTVSKENYEDMENSWDKKEKK
jgi:hypothetical protein